MTIDYTIRQYQPSDEDDIVELLKIAFNGWPNFDLSYTPVDYWKWKFLDNPFSRKIIVKAVSNSNNKIIGCHHGIDLNIKIGDDLHHVNYSTDLAVHPDYRRMGIWTNIRKLRTKIRISEGSKLSIWTSDNPIVVNNIQNPNHIELSDVLHYYKIRKLDLHFKMTPSNNTWTKKFGYRILNSISKISNFFKKPRISLDKKVTIKKISKFDDRINKFWEKISKEYSFIVERHKNYLNWRYCDPRGGKYRVYIAEDDDTIVGYSVVRINKYDQDYHKGYIVDLLSLPDRFDVSEALIQEAVELFDYSKVNFIDCLAVRNSQLAEGLLRCGFLDSRQKIFIVISPREMNKDEIKNISNNISKNKHFVYGDFDSI